ncbi:MAG: NADAR family protein [Candidatus Methylacidiphilales bacterium]|nr:NADAR family protein [Candidatus Methylacidiphilales bacterium]
MAIRFFGKDNPNGEFSNFAPYPFTLDDAEWPTVEHYFQAQKFLDPIEKERVRVAASPAKARSLGRRRTVPIRTDWEAVKLGIMKDGVRAKFAQHAELRRILLATGDEEIIEASPRDYTWGCGAKGTGKNLLGKILAEIRTELSQT